MESPSRTKKNDKFEKKQESIIFLLPFHWLIIKVGLHLVSITNYLK